MNLLLAVIIVEILCVVGVVADYYLKIAGSGDTFLNTKPFLFGSLLYAATGFGWFLAMKYMTLVQVGVFYSVSMVLLLTGLGVFKFGETIGTKEGIGIVLALLSLLLTSKFN